MSNRKLPAVSSAGPKPSPDDPKYQEWYRKTRLELEPEWRKQETKAYRVAHPEKVKAWKAAYYERHKEQHKADVYARRAKEPERWRTYNREYQRKRVKHLSEAHRHRRYGLTLGQIDAMLIAQDHRCAICHRQKPPIKKLCVDHCHTVNLVRGILCDDCNRGLGNFHDNIEWLASAIDYLKRFPPHAPVVAT